MRLVHLADLHIGIRVNGFFLLEDQSYLLEQILAKIDQISPDVIMMSGDIYDKAQPSSAAVQLLDNFLERLLIPERRVLIIPGNHDSAERLSFGAKILKKQGLHIAGPFAGQPETVELQDQYGRLIFVLLPYLRPAHVRAFSAEDEIKNTAEAVQFALQRISYDPDVRYVLLAHQFVVSGASLPEQSESETIYAGGIEAVDSSLFADFSYVALGHLHKPQKMGQDHIRYAGSLLKYSFSEVKVDKKLLQIDLREKGQIEIKEHQLTPLRDLRELRGNFLELLQEGADLLAAKDPQRLDYLKITLTDQEVLADPLSNLRRFYPNIMQLRNEQNKNALPAESMLDLDDLSSLSKTEIFSRFFKERQDREINQREEEILAGLKIKGFFSNRGKEK